jgi:hypothetical protein
VEALWGDIMNDDSRQSRSGKAPLGLFLGSAAFMALAAEDVIRHADRSVIIIVVKLTMAALLAAVGVALLRRDAGGPG